MIDMRAMANAERVRREQYQRWNAPPPRSFLSVLDVSDSEFSDLIGTALDMKQSPKKYERGLVGRKVALLFQKTSTRTRVSFESGIASLGGSPIYIDWRTSNFALASLQDEIRVLSRFVDLTMARVYEHADLESMASHSEVPIINGLSDYGHPCQALSDFCTMQEYFGVLKGLHVVYVGDGNNMAHSLMESACRAQASITICTPRNYGPNAALVSHLRGLGTDIRFIANPREAVVDADVIYTDTWVSMGEEAIAEKKMQAFAGYQVDAELVNCAPAHAIVMHCLPAHRDVEIASDVMDSDRCVMFHQTENRRYVQQALMMSFLRPTAGNAKSDVARISADGV